MNLTGLGKLLVLLNVALAIGLGALGFGIYTNRIDWPGAVPTAKGEKATSEYADRLAAGFRNILDRRPAASEASSAVRLLGPAEAPVFRLKGYYRFHFQLQSSRSAFLHEVLRAVLPTVHLPQNVELTVDIDPQDML